MVVATADAVDLPPVWCREADGRVGPQVSGLRLSGGDVTATGPTYAFDRCDECGAPLEPESRLHGLCSACERLISDRPPSPTPPT